MCTMCRRFSGGKPWVFFASMLVYLRVSLSDTHIFNNDQMHATTMKNMDMTATIESIQYAIIHVIQWQGLDCFVFARLTGGFLKQKYDPSRHGSWWRYAICMYTLYIYNIYICTCRLYVHTYIHNIHTIYVYRLIRIYNKWYTVT